MSSTQGQVGRVTRRAGVRVAAVFGLAISGLTATASADSLVVTTDPGVPQNTDAITGFATSGDDMVGMLVTAFFSNGSSENSTWQATSSIAGQAAGTGWTLSESGDTFGGDWFLTNTSAPPISRVVLDGAPGRTVFDINPGSPDTPNSAGGLPFTLRGGGTGRDIAVTYRDRVGVGGNAPAGDLYRRMDVQFNAPGGPITAGSASLVFETDTDNATSDVIPEPSAAILMLAALGGLSVRRRARTVCRARAGTV